MKTTLYLRGICTGKLITMDTSDIPLENQLPALMHQKELIERTNSQPGPKVKGPVLICIQGGKQ